MEYLLSHSIFNAVKAPLANVSKRFFVHAKDHVIPSPRNAYRPHLLSNRALVLYSVMLLAVKISVISLTVVGPTELALSSEITRENVFSLTNDSRKENKIGLLSWDDKLAQAAQEKADDMLDKGYFAHTSPDGRLPWDFITASGYNYLTAGENLAEGFIEAETTEEAWMNSPGHRANILNKNFEQIGVGISKGKYQGHQTIFVVQMFGTPMDQPLKVLREPTPVAEPKVAATPVPTPTKTPVPAPAPVPATKQNVVPSPVASPTPAPVVTAENGEVVAEKMEIVNSRVLLTGDEVIITVTTSGPVAKALVSFDQGSVVLDPKSDNIWEATMESSKIRGSKLVATVHDINGMSAQKLIATFAPSIKDSYGNEGKVKGETINIWGRSLDLAAIEYRFYLIFVAALLSALVLAIGFKRHVQHIGLISNTAFVAILALMFWMQ